MGREQKNIYCFISDENNRFYRATQQHDGSYYIPEPIGEPFPITNNPPNLLKSNLEFATNMEYMSLARSINYPLDFIKDGAAILRKLYLFGRGVEQKTYLTVIEWNGDLGIYEMSYTGRFDFSQKDEFTKPGIFTIPLVDDSAWGVLSRYDKVKFSIDCSPYNSKAVRVLIDGLTLLNRYNYQTVKSPLALSDNTKSHYLIPFVLINQDGDSAGIITKNQTYTTYYDFETLAPGLITWFFSTLYPITGAKIFGTFSFECTISKQPYALEIYFYTSNGQRFTVFSRIFGEALITGFIYTLEFNFTLDLAMGENVFFVARAFSQHLPALTITPIVTNIYISTKTKTEPQVVYGLRAGDLLQQIVTKATKGRYTINSNFFNINNKSVCLSGDAIRSVPNAEIYTSFADFYKTFNSIYWLALRVINGSLWMEKFTEVYRTDTGDIIDLGEAIEVRLSPAMEFYCNEVQVGSPKQDFRHPNGRLEFNSTNTFSLSILSSTKKLDLVTEYRLGCFDIQFLLLDYKGGSSEDNNGDKSVYVLDISDEQGTAVDNIETFENITIDNAILEPIIKSPADNDTITFNKPIIRGISPPLATVNIYADNVLDGGTVADASGNWSYNLVNALSSWNGTTLTGEHTIDATFTDTSAPKSSITLVINTTITTETKILYPRNGDNLYNNKPLIKGKAQKDTNIDILIDGVLVNSIVADASCKWEYKSVVLLNGNHTIQVGSQTVFFNVDTNIAYPLITYIGSELDGFVVINNLPLIEGVAKPNTEVTIWLNYITYQYLGRTYSNASGNWSFQVVPINYIDPVSGAIIILAPIQNGLNIFSTDLVNHIVGINVLGYKLNRPNYTSIIGVTDNTVFNTNFSPKRMLKPHYPLFASMLKNQPQEFMYYQTSDKNANLITVLNGVTVSERADVSVSELGEPFAILEWAKIKVRALKTFSQTLYDFNNGGTIKTTFRGTPIFMLPIGSMKLNNIINDIQEWKLLVSTLTSYIDLFNLYNTGLKLKVMKNSLYHSDYNTLHFVEYNFQQNAKYNHKTIYQDWFNNRNDSWITNPDYIQKIQTSDPVKDQIIANGLSVMSLRMYRCLDAFLIAVIPYTIANPQPITPPEVVWEAVIDFSLYPEGQYFFVMMVGELEVAISERIQSKVKWPKTLLVEASHSINETGAFFSTGFKTVLRVEGMIKKLQPELDTILSTDDIGNKQLLYSSVTRKAEMRFGTAYGLPDYLYLKLANALALDNLLIENGYYTLGQEQIAPADELDGHPLYYYNVVLGINTNVKGITLDGITGGTGTNTQGVVIVVDATAFGMPVGSLINIELGG